MGDSPKWVKSRRRRKKRRERKKERLNNGNNNGQATHGARKHAWRTQAAWANNQENKVLSKYKNSPLYHFLYFEKVDHNDLISGYFCGDHSHLRQKVMDMKKSILLVLLWPARAFLDGRRWTCTFNYLVQQATLYSKYLYFIFYLKNICFY